MSKESNSPANNKLFDLYRRLIQIEVSDIFRYSHYLLVALGIGVIGFAAVHFLSGIIGSILLWIAIISLILTFIVEDSHITLGFAILFGILYWIFDNNVSAIKQIIAYITLIPAGVLVIESIIYLGIQGYIKYYDNSFGNVIRISDSSIVAEDINADTSNVAAALLFMRKHNYLDLLHNFYYNNFKSDKNLSLYKLWEKVSSGLNKFKNESKLHLSDECMALYSDALIVCENIAIETIYKKNSRFANADSFVAINLKIDETINALKDLDNQVKSLMKKTEKEKFEAEKQQFEQINEMTGEHLINNIDGFTQKAKSYRDAIKEIKEDIS